MTAKKWEYMAMSRPVGVPSRIEDIESMNEKGAEGWELVCSVQSNQHLGATNKVVLYFKREVPA